MAVRLCQPNYCGPMLRVLYSAFTVVDMVLKRISLDMVLKRIIFLLFCLFLKISSAVLDLVLAEISRILALSVS